MRVHEFRIGTTDSYLTNFTNIAGTLYLRANDGVSGYELWKSDGTDAGTVRVKEIKSGVASGVDVTPFGGLPFTNLQGTLYFRANDGVNGDELWKSDGTDAGTVPVRLTNVLPLLNPAASALVGDRVYVVATRPLTGSALWSRDLSAPGLLGDYNIDSIVNQNDYDFWRAHFGDTSGFSLQADGNGNGVVDAADYTLWRHNFGALGDDHADSAVKATPVTIASTTGGIIGNSSDADWFSFKVNSQNTVTATVTLNGLSGAVLEFFAADGSTVIASDSDGGAGNVTAALNTSGVYFARVVGFGGATGAFTLNLTATSDDHGNSAAVATPIAIPGTTAGMIGSATDADWFTFYALQGQTIIASATLGTLSGAVLELFLPGGSTVLASDTNGGAGNVSVFITSSGVYYARVAGFGGATGSYTLGMSLDDHGNNAAAATSVAIPSTTAGVLVSGDSDWLRFNIRSGGVQLTLSATLGTLSGAVLKLYAANGTTVLASDTNGGAGSIIYNVISAGDYYAEVTGFAGATGSYTLGVGIFDDHGNSAATATPLPGNGIPLSGALETSSDSDWFSLTVPGFFAALVSVTVGGGPGVVARLRASDGVTVILSDSDGGNAVLTISSVPFSVVYYIEVLGFGGATGAYTVINFVIPGGSGATTEVEDTSPVLASASARTVRAATKVGDDTIFASRRDIDMASKDRAPVWPSHRPASHSAQKTTIHHDAAMLLLCCMTDHSTIHPLTDQALAAESTTSEYYDEVFVLLSDWPDNRGHVNLSSSAAGSRV